MPALPTHLVRVGAMYKYRSRIPTDLLSFYAPKREITESLHTKSLTEAKHLLPAVQLKYQQEWANLRAALGADFTDLVLNDAGIQYVTALLEHESLSGDEATRVAGHYEIEEIIDYRSRLTESIACLRDAAAVGDVASIRPAVEQYLHFKKLKPVGQPEDFDRLALAYLRAAIRTNEALLVQMNGEAVDLPTLPPSPNRKLSVIPASGPRTSLYSLFGYWRDAVANRPQRTIDDFERRVQAFDETADKDVKRLKNVGSRRLIPISQTLIEHGFLDYVRYQQKQKGSWLFPQLKEDKAYGRRGGNWSKWWSRWRTKLGVTGRDKCFHAFRHVFKTAGRAAGVSEDIHDAITGHAGGGVGRDYGYFPLEALKPAIDKVAYTELKLQGAEAFCESACWAWRPVAALGRIAGWPLRCDLFGWHRRWRWMETWGQRSRAGKLGRAVVERKIISWPGGVLALRLSRQALGIKAEYRNATVKAPGVGSEPENRLAA